MKKIIIALTLVFCTVQVSLAQMNTKTKNKIKVKYFAATDSFEKKNYVETIEKINEIEALTKGVRIPTALNLKIKSLVKLKRYAKAKKELNILEGLELDDSIIKDMATYSGLIEKEFKRERDAVLKEKEDARLALIRKNEKAKEDAIKRENERTAKLEADNRRRVKKQKEIAAKQKDNENWDAAKLKNTVIGYKNYINNSDNKLYSGKARDKVIGLIWRNVIDADDIITSAKEYLVDNPNGQNKRRAKKFIKYADITSLTITHYSESSMYVKDQNGNYLSDKKEVLKNLGYFVNLKSLNIKVWKGKKNKEIFLYCLRNLEEISLGSNVNVTFNSIKSLAKLKKYTTKSKGVSDFFKLTTLEKVDAIVTDYQIEKLLSNNKNLKDLTLKFSGTIFPKNINLFTKLSELERLTFSNLGDYKYGMPNTIGNLKKLRYLSLKNLKVNLPEEIGNLSKLEILYLNSADINTLPQSIGNLKNLQSLYLQYADITSLPESFVLLTNLNNLNVTTPKEDYTKNELWRNKDVRKVIKRLKKANSGLNLITK